MNGFLKKLIQGMHHGEGGSLPIKPLNITKQAMDATSNELLSDFLQTKKDVLDIIAVVDLPRHPKNREYVPELEALLDNVDYYTQELQILDALDTIKTIVGEYKSKLTKEDLILLKFKQVKLYIDYKDMERARKALKTLEPYMQYFDQDDKINYHFFAGSIFYAQAIDKQNIRANMSLTYFIKAIDAFQMPNTTTILPNNTYISLKFNIALCHYHMRNFDICDEILSEISTIPEATSNEIFATHIFYLHGAIYQKLEQYDKAIASYKKYLQYQPDDMQTKQIIRLLSEKSPE